MPDDKKSKEIREILYKTKHAAKFLNGVILIGFIFSGYIFNVLGFADYDNLLEKPGKIGIDLLLFSIGLHIKPSKIFNFGYKRFKF